MSVLFCDLSGYTSLSERADPEVVRLLVSRVLSEAAQVVEQYEGHIERFLGDAVMAVFGVPEVHEDDAQRAVLAALEIERCVEEIPVDEVPGTDRLKMHSAVATGFAVHGEIGPSEAGETVLGDTVNVAARLTHFAAPGEIVVGENTHQMTCGRFDYEPLGSLEVRGRTEPVPAYRLLAYRRDAVSVRRVTGLRARFVGRGAELAVLRSAAKRAMSGSSSFVAILGGPGSGKSRLAEEFRAWAFDGWKRDRPLKWLSAECAPYSQRRPYAALKDLLGREWELTGNDRPEVVRETIAWRLERRGIRDPVRTARIARLWGLEDASLAGMDPEAWRVGLYEDMLMLLGALAADGLPIMLIEDLHWADRQSLDVLRHVHSHTVQPLMTVCTSRSMSTILTFEPPEIGEGLQVLRLGQLDAAESIEMCRSLLGSDSVPQELQQLVAEEFGGNPFFIEEMVNSLVEKGWLERKRGEWLLKRPLENIDVPLTIAELIEARIDQLGPVTKRVAQEAALVGGTFPIDVLSCATAFPDSLQSSLDDLAAQDLIRPVDSVPGEPVLRWAFRHALIRDVIEGELLAEDRAAIHDRIGQAFEKVYGTSANSIADVIAGHLSRGTSKERAVSYLVYAAESCLDRNAVEEADSLYREAYSICAVRDRDEADARRDLVSLLCGWARVGYYMGDCRGLEELLETHYEDAMSIDDAQLKSTYEFWLGNTLWHRERLHEAEDHLKIALELAGPPLCDPALQSVAHAELAYTYADLGRLSDAEEHAARAGELAVVCPHDYFVWQAAFGASAYLAWCLGRTDRALSAAHNLLHHAESYGNVRCLAFGHWSLALASAVDGDLGGAVKEDSIALRASSDPWLLQFPKFFMAICVIQRGDFVRARELLEDLIGYAEERGATTLAVPARGLLGAAMVGSGDADKGIALLQETERRLRGDERTWAQLNALFILGQLHALVAMGQARAGLRVVLRNPRFLFGHALRADAIAQRQLTAVIERADEIGASGLSGQCWLALARLHEAKDRMIAAAGCYTEALRRFEECGASSYCCQVSEARAGLELVAR